MTTKENVLSPELEARFLALSKEAKLAVQAILFGFDIGGVKPGTATAEALYYVAAVNDDRQGISTGN